LLSFASSTVGLTNGSKETTHLAMKLASTYPNIPIIGGTYFKNSEPNIEFEVKRRAFGERFIDVGPVTSTTDECEAIINKSIEMELFGDEIILVDEEWHSIRARIVWEYYLSQQTKLCLQLASAWKCSDRKNPMPLQRNFLVWGLANLFLAPLYKWYPGVAWWAKKNFNQSFE
jgi:hypothetical protein